MSELRKDPITGRWVIIEPMRAQRPIHYQEVMKSTDVLFDPFAEGNESATPPEILAFRDGRTGANGPGWRVRVVPNKFPALQVEGTLENRGDGIYDMMTGIGAHEVIIEGPTNKPSLTNLPLGTVREVLLAYRDRLNDLKKDQRLVHALIFKNKGPLAGASLEHSHSQLIATSVVPGAVQEELDGSRRFFEYRGRSIFDDMIRQELVGRERVVSETPNYLTFCPYASRFPFETWIVPKFDASHYETIERPRLDELGLVLKTTLAKLEQALDDPPYNYVLHSAPFNVPQSPHFRWHLEILPRLTRLGGFEWGSGVVINSVPPEEAARYLRDVDIAVEEF